VVSDHFPWQALWANIFIFADFFSEKKKEARDIPKNFGMVL
jgi:hypothetical protein